MNRLPGPQDRRASQIESQYARRPAAPPRQRARIPIWQERFDAIRACLRPLEPLASCALLEVGASTGYNVPVWRQLGFREITLNDIRPAALDEAARWGVTTVGGDAATLDLPPFNVVYAGLVFSSILEDADRHDIAAGLWRLTRLDGMIIIYDFTWNNPANLDVRKVTSSDMRRLFPAAAIQSRRLTLAPPIARRIPAWLYPFVNISVFKTHRLWWFRKVQAVMAHAGAR
jgi:SAM-dependent methyltransferase